MLLNSNWFDLYVIEKDKPFAEENIQKPEYLTKRIVSMKPEGKLQFRWTLEQTCVHKSNFPQTTSAHMFYI